MGGTIGPELLRFLDNADANPSVMPPFFLTPPFGVATRGAIAMIVGVGFPPPA